MAVLESCPKHNMVAYLEKTEGNVEFHEVIDFLARSSIHNALTVSPVVSTTFVEQFWMSAKSKIINNVRYITAKVAGKPVSISEASIRSDLLFDDADGIDSLPNQAIFDAIQLMGDKGFPKPFYLFMLLCGVQPTEDEGAPSERPFEAQATPSPPHTSEVPIERQPDPSPTHTSEVLVEPQTDPIPRTLPSTTIPDSLPESMVEFLEDSEIHWIIWRLRMLKIWGGQEISAKEKVSTNRPIVSTDGSKVSTNKQKDSIDEKNEGTDDQIEGTDEQSKGTDDHTDAGSATQSTQPPTSIIFEYEETIAQTREEENRMTEDESESESNVIFDIPEAEKKFKQLASDEEMARKVQEEWEGEEERKRLAEEEVPIIEIMEKKSVIARLSNVSSPDGDYLVIYRANENFRGFNYLMELAVQDSYSSSVKTNQICRQLIGCRDLFSLGLTNTIELPVGNNVVPLRSDTIRLVQNECSFHRLRFEDPNQHLKDFLKLVDSLDLDGENKERTCLRLFQFSLRDQASNWLERLPAGSITTWKDLTTRFLAQFFQPGRTTKLYNDILMFQQHHGESLSEAWTRLKDLLQKVPHHGIDLWLQLCDLNAKESWAFLEDLALYDNKNWNDPRDLAKPVKAIALPQDVLSTSDLVPMTLSIAWKTPNKPLLTTHPYVPMKREVSDARIFEFEDDFKQQQSEMTNKIDTMLKAITDRIAGTLPSDTVKNPKLATHPVLSTCSYPTIDPQCSTQIHSSVNAITIYPKQQSDSHDRTEENEEEERGSPKNHPDSPTPPDPSISFITEKVLKFNSVFESPGLVPPSPNAELVCTKEEDGDVMFIKIISKDDNS
ncbi:MAK10-like protein [Tanacetum coccineum]